MGYPERSVVKGKVEVSAVVGTLCTGGRDAIADEFASVGMLVAFRGTGKGLAYGNEGPGNGVIGEAEIAVADGTPPSPEGETATTLEDNVATPDGDGT
jgi:hypothetical protein